MTDSSIDNGSPVVEVKNLTKIFGSNPKKGLDMLHRGADRDEIFEKTGQTVGVDQANFEVHKGEILVVMGLSGSGKSTLARCINRLIEPTEGEILIDGDNVLDMNHKELLQLRRERIGMVFQRFALLPRRTVLQNTEFGLEIRGISKEERRDKAMQAIELVGLKGWEDHLPGQLSGGMQQRVGLARAFAAEPEIILMDEALSALDPLIRRDMQSEIVDLQNNLGVTIIFISHDLDEAINVGDRIVLMKDGAIVQTGTAEAILTEPANDYVAQFVENIDVAKVLNAESIMHPVHEIAYLEDGPHVVLRKMRNAGHSSLFVVDANKKLKGFVRAEKLKEQKDQIEKIKDVVEEEVRSVHPNTFLEEITPMMAESSDPVAVIDENDKIKGVIVTGALLSGLAEGASVE